MELFDIPPQTLEMPDAEVVYFPRFFAEKAANHYFDILFEETPWQQDDIRVFGKVYPQPRLTALYGNNGKPYSYSNITMQPERFTETLNEIKALVEQVAQTSFTTALLNLYRDGTDSNGWHADDEKELGTDPVIASISLGATRRFHFKHKHDKDLKQKLLLDHGSLLLMKGPTQHHWLHQLPKTAKKIDPRINITFRVIK
ncbi:alpha-ketoglutarate-dependent dioxygenase AlkB family protein [Sungkyunkwania multivorans]|uniref:Alpha-ketoglutarate-dependent dioxygenase AlkB family protein n=1 Tax=Sungkyunkwania multivorans TaxID=1173618 RepID=A0ABW3CVU8_9FLAO